MTRIIIRMAGRRKINKRLLLRTRSGLRAALSVVLRRRGDATGAARCDYRSLAG